MPRKAKEKIEKNEIIDEKKTAVKKTSTAKKAGVKSDSAKPAKAKKASTKSDSAASTKTKKTTTRKSALAKIIEDAASNSVEEKQEKVSKPASKKTNSSKATSPSKKVATTKKEVTSKKSNSTKKAEPTKKATRKKANKKEQPPVKIAEYYDLPYKYGNTVVKLLAQTPNTLFVYWEVSENDIENFKKLYGEDFFNKTRPILIVHNSTLNKTYEVEINDFANCWYLNIEDSDCKFDIELGRRFIENSSNDEPDFLYIATSNNLQAPNDHILFEKIKEFVVFRNVSNDNVIKKNIKSFKFLKDIYKFYKDMYDEEVLNNPSSQFKF